MANRSAAQSFPFERVHRHPVRRHVAAAVAVQPARAVQRRGDDGGLVGWRRSPGATSSSVIVAGSSGGIGLVRLTTMVCESSCGTAGVLRPSMTTSSQTMPPAPGPSVVVGVCVPPSVRVQYASLSPASVSRVVVAGLDGHRRQTSRPARARWSAAVRRPGAPCRRWWAPERAARRRSASSGVAGRPAAASVDGVGRRRRDGRATVDVGGLGRADEHAATRTAAPRMRDEAADAAVHSPILWLGFGLVSGFGCGRSSRRFGGVDRVRVGAELCGLVVPSASLIASGSTSFSVRNRKKNTTQPIAEMKIQLTSR